MRARRFLQSLLTASLALLLVLGVFMSGASLAQDPVPEAEDVLEEPFPPDNPRPLGAGPITSSVEAASAGVLGIPSQPTGGPDSYGYTWQDSAAVGGLYSWIDAKASGTGFMTGNDMSKRLSFAPGFEFPFYENTYTSVYVSTNGLLSFGGGTTTNNNQAMPLTLPPNNVIAAFWDDLAVGSPYNSGKIYVKQPRAPGDPVVIEWNGVTRKDYTTPFSFEVVLYPSGNILIQYKNRPVPANSGTVGIEDEAGAIGLTYLCNSSTLAAGTAVLFVRPDPACRLKILPWEQDSLGAAGTAASYSLYLRNTGNVGACDSFDLSQASTWDLSLYHEDGVTPLVSPVTLAQGEGLTITARVAIPAAAAVGAYNQATITACAGANCFAANLRTAVPAPFAQIYAATPDKGASIYLAHPDGQAGRLITGALADDRALAAAKDGFVAVWTQERIFGPANLTEVVFAMRDHLGAKVQSPKFVADLTGVSNSTHDTEPAVAGAPNGRIGVVWLREIHNTALGYNYNVYFAVLGQVIEGGLPVYRVVAGPTNLTNNGAYGPSSGSGSIRFYSPHIAATADTGVAGANRFFIAWQREQTTGTGSKDDIYCAIYDVNGAVRKAAWNLTADATGGTGYFDPAPTALDGNYVLLAYSRRGGGSLGAIRYMVFDYAGNVSRSSATLFEDSSPNQGPAAVQLSDGHILVAWDNESDIRYKVLESDASSPTALGTVDNPSGLGGQAYVSAVADGSGHGILTWTEEDSSIRTSVYYALVNADGTQVHPALAFLSGQGKNPRASTSVLGYGAAPFNPPAGVDLWVKGPSLPAAAFGGVANVPVQYGNRGISPATATLTATLPLNVEYDSDTSGLTPVVSPDGRVVTWTLPESEKVHFLETRSFALHLRVTAGDPGTRYQVDLATTSAEAEDPATTPDNTASFEVVVPYKTYVPFEQRGCRPPC